MRISELDTPALLIDADRLNGNLAAMAQQARAAGLALRPHTKTHKVPQIAKMQVEQGAVGITVAKVGEAEVMARAGLQDIFVANQVVGEVKVARLVGLARLVRVAAGVDSLGVAEPLSRAFATEGMRLNVLLEIDTGGQRCGVRPGAEAAELAAQIGRLPGLNLAGIFTYPGHVYRAESKEQIAQIAAEEGRQMADAAQRLQPMADVSGWVSGGSTPTAFHYTSGGGLTEIRPGAYVYRDLNCRDTWCGRYDDCALTVLTTVISAPQPYRVIVDAGSKALSADRAVRAPGFGVLREAPDAFLDTLNEEHGFLNLTQAGLRLRVGDKVQVIPNHCCSVSNLFDEVHVVQGSDVLESYPVAARGKSR
jgi:D-serine deaminase-like pyridoxal phosphate-dependent protein